MAEERKQNRGLGRGLSALLADIQVDEENTQSSQVSARTADTLPIEFLVANKNQPRKEFDQAALNELATSISEKGLVQPIIVRAVGKDRYEIVAGERRWRAAQIAKMHQVPVIIREYSDIEVQEIALIENIQRRDLNVLEEASAYQDLMSKYGHTQERLSQSLGKSRSHIANLLRLLTLPVEVQSELRAGNISMGHARALIGVNLKDALAILRDVKAQQLSVREVESRVKALVIIPEEKRERQKPQKNADTKSLEQELSAALGMQVSIQDKSGRGELRIRYKNLDELDRLCQIIGK